MLNKDEEKVLGSFNKADKPHMASADTYQLDFYGIQKGEEKMDEEETSEQKKQDAEAAPEKSSEDMEKMMYKMIEEGVSKMMEGEDSPMSKMMLKMMRKMMDSDKKVDKALSVDETTALTKSEPVMSDRGRDALLGWLSK